MQMVPGIPQGVASPARASDPNPQFGSAGQPAVRGGLQPAPASLITALQQLATRQVDMTVTGVPSLMQLKESGAPIITVGSAYSQNPFYPAVLENSPIRSIKDFKGKTVAVTSLTVSHVYWLNAILAAEGMKPTDVTLVPVGGAGGNVFHAMKTGEVDVFQAFDAAYANLETIDAKLRLFDDLPYLKDLSFIRGIYVNEDIEELWQQSRRPVTSFTFQARKPIWVGEMLTLEGTAADLQNVDMRVATSSSRCAMESHAEFAA
jgi:NMT1/THI5 like